MRIEIDIPDALLRQAKVSAAREGTTLHAVVIRSLQAAVEREARAGPTPAPWRRLFGGLRHLHKDTERVNAAVEEAFERIDGDMWR